MNFLMPESVMLSWAKLSCIRLKCLSNLTLCWHLSIRQFNKKSLCRIAKNGHTADAD